MTPSSIILGTRGSKLARVQTAQVKVALESRHEGLRCEEQIVKTIGDQRPDLKLSEFSKTQVVDKGIFTKDLEVALRNRQIDVAVHSLKDLPTAIDPALCIAAVMLRADTADVVVTRKKVSADLRELPQGARVATGSVRRKAQLLHIRPDLAVEDMRGNVPTRLRKLFASQAPDAIVLAVAGLQRLGYLSGMDSDLGFEGNRLFAARLVPPYFLPASGQGAIGLQCRTDDTATRSLLESINHVPTMVRVTFERAVLDRLEAGCHTPVGIHTSINGENQLTAQLRVFDEEDLTRAPREAKVSGSAGNLSALVDQLMKALYA